MSEDTEPSNGEPSGADAEPDPGSRPGPARVPGPASTADLPITGGPRFVGSTLATGEHARPIHSVLSASVAYEATHAGPRTPGTNKAAIATLAFAVAWLGGIGSVVALVIGPLALGQVRQRNQAGRGIAMAGLIVGVLGLALSLFVAGSLYTDPAFLRHAPRSFQELASSVRESRLSEGEKEWCANQRSRLKDATERFEDERGRPARSEDELVRAGLLDRKAREYDVEDGTVVRNELGREFGCRLP
jgi:hypothetical protein